MIKRYYKFIKEVVFKLFKDTTLEDYEKYLLKNKGKKARFRYKRNGWGDYELYFNANKNDLWIQTTKFIYDGSKNSYSYHNPTYRDYSLHSYIETHPMIDDIYNDFEGDADYIRKEIQRKKDYDRSHNIYN